MLENLDQPVDLIEYYIRTTESAGAAIIQTSPEQRDKVLAIIRERSSISHSDLLRRCWRIANAQELRDITDDLERLGRIRKRVGGIYGGIVYDYIEKRSR